MNIDKEYFIFFGFYATGLLIRNGYELFYRSGRSHHTNKWVLAVVFVAMCLMWAGWFDMCSLDPLHVEMPVLFRGIGFSLFLAGLFLSIGSAIQLRGVENIDHLVTGGLYSKIRHPMYAGFILWIVGWGLYHGAVISLAAGLPGIGSILYWKKNEDSALELRFGEEYREYRKGTRF